MGTQEEITEIAEWLRDKTTAGLEYLKESPDLHFAIFFEPIGKIQKDTNKYLAKKLPLKDYTRQLAITGGAFLEQWVEMKQDVDPELEPAIARKIETFRQSPKGDLDSFMRAVYALQDQDSWVYMGGDREAPDPCYGILLQSARLCKRHLKLQQQIENN